MIADAGQDPAPYEAIIVHSRSRFFRDLFEFLGYERRLKRAGVRVISITQQTADDPAGEMASKIFSLFDEYQSKENGKHTLAGDAGERAPGLLQRLAPTLRLSSGGSTGARQQGPAQEAPGRRCGRGRDRAPHLRALSPRPPGRSDGVQEHRLFPQRARHHPARAALDARARPRGAGQSGLRRGVLLQPHRRQDPKNQASERMGEARRRADHRTGPLPPRAIAPRRRVRPRSSRRAWSVRRRSSRGSSSATAAAPA